MMEVYHGSSVHGLDIIKPNKSTHGNYVYATTNKAIAVVMSHNCGSDFTYYFGRDSKDNPYDLVERLPGVFDIMFKNDASIYTLDGSNFKDIKTGFNEVVSEENQTVIKEEKISVLLEELENLKQDKKINIYRYPNKPEDMPKDNSDLIDKLDKKEDFETLRSKYISLLSYYPELLEKVNDKLFSVNKGFPGFDTKDLFKIIEHSIEKYNLDPKSEPFLKIKLDKFVKLYPIYFKDINLVDTLKSKEKNGTK